MRLFSLLIVLAIFSRFVEGFILGERIGNRVGERFFQLVDVRAVVQSYLDALGFTRSIAGFALTIAFEYVEFSDFADEGGFFHKNCCVLFCAHQCLLERVFEE